MKKMAFLFCAIAVVALSSCNKEKNCTCAGTMNGESVGSTTSMTIEDGDCSDGNSTTGSGDYVVKVTCTED